MSEKREGDHERARALRERLNNRLRRDRFGDGPRDAEEDAALFFQREIFDELLSFERTRGPTGQQPYRSVPVQGWPQSAEADSAQIISRESDFRVVYVVVESMTRTAERGVVRALTETDPGEGWALDGRYLAIFHERDSDVWHLVTPYEEGRTVAEGRSKLRRFTIGEGENHRTVAEKLSGLAATKPGVLSSRVNEAFRVRPVTEEFYRDYREWFERMEDELRREYSPEKAGKYAHLTLNRLMFFYFLQNKRWFGGRKNFVRWFHGQYRQSDDRGCFHSRWLDALFFDATNSREGKAVEADLPAEVETTLEDLPCMNGGLFGSRSSESRGATLPDDLLSGVVRDFLERYNFTITEESPYDVDVAVDPAMLGKVYESLIAREERGDVGIFYTPRTEVDLMCRMALYDQLTGSAGMDSPADRERVIELLFADPGSVDLDTGDRSAIERMLAELDIVDPGCGSGAFLVGMVRVLTELYRKLGRTPGYDLKRQIINQNIYGVDTTGWALRVAEFRLWLTLVETEDEIPERRPVLPGVTFNLQRGDSIVQTVGDQPLTMAALSRSPNPEVTSGLGELGGLKQRYYDGERELHDDISRRKTELLEQHISALVERNDDGTRQALDGVSVDDDQRRAVERLKRVQRGLESVDADSPFLWELDFSEVMLDGGFDIVIGNPPYISNESITDPRYGAETLEEMNDDRQDAIQRRYRDNLAAYVQRTHGFDPDGQSDYYAHFFYRGFDILRPGGTLSFITSDRWLDRGYGVDLQEFLLTRTRLRSVLTNRLERSFEEADITTAITTFTKVDGDGRRVGGTPRFVSCSAPYSRLAAPDEVRNILWNGRDNAWVAHSDDDDRTVTETEYRGERLDVTSTPLARVVDVAADKLWRLGGGEASNGGADSRVDARGSYEGDKWGSVLIRAPTAMFEVLGEREGRMSTLGEHGVESYLNAGGALKFYVVDRVGDEGGGLARIRNRRSGEEFVVEDRFLEPFVKSSKDVSHLRITKDDAEGARIVSIPPSTDVEAHHIGDYIQHGEELAFHRRSGPSKQTPWWKPPNRAADGASIVLPRTHNDNHRALYNPERAITGRFYRVDVDDDEAEFLAAVLNSTFGSLFFEIYGDPRGQGALDLYTDDYRKIPIVDPSEADSTVLPGGSTAIFDREIGSVFEEVGAESPSDVDLGSVMDDRRALDEFVMGEILGLTEKQQREVYRGLVRLVGERIDKAESV